MSKSKNVAYALCIAALIVLSNLAIIKICKIENENHISKGVIDGTMVSWANSQSFLDEVYTFNVDGIAGRVESLILLYSRTQPEISICISVEINSFSHDDSEDRTYCSKGESLISMTSREGQHVLSGSEEITIGLKKLGSLSWYVGNSKAVPFYKRDGFCNMLVVLICFMQLSALLLTCRFGKRKTHNIKNESEPNEEVLALTQRLSNIGKIIDRNKRVFAVNRDLLYASYEHPYTNTVYTNGKSERLRCSLVELENSFGVDLVRLNRSTLINQSIIADFGDVKSQKDKKSYQVVLEVKSKKIELEIGKQSEAEILKLFS